MLTHTFPSLYQLGLKRTFPLSVVICRTQGGLWGYSGGNRIANRNKPPTKLAALQYQHFQKPMKSNICSLYHRRGFAFGALIV